MTSQSSADRINRTSNELLEATSFLFGTNAAFVESLYAQYLENPDAVDPSWRNYFASLGQTELDPAQVGRGPQWRRDRKTQHEDGELVSALTGQLAATKGKVSEADLQAVRPVLRQFVAAVYELDIRCASPEGIACLTWQSR